MTEWNKWLENHKQIMEEKLKEKERNKKNKGKKKKNKPSKNIKQVDGNDNN